MNVYRMPLTGDVVLDFEGADISALCPIKIAPGTTGITLLNSRAYGDSRTLQEDVSLCVAWLLTKHG